MHIARRQRINKELKNARALEMRIEFKFNVDKLPISHTVEFDHMPALLFEADNKSVIKCLPLNMVGIGDSDDEAFTNLADDISELLKDILNESKLLPLSKGLLVGSSADIYWNKFETLTKAKPSQPKAMPKTITRDPLNRGMNR